MSLTPDNKSSSKKFFLSFIHCNIDKSSRKTPSSNFGKTSYTKNYCSGWKIFLQSIKTSFPIKRSTTLFMPLCSLTTTVGMWCAPFTNVGVYQRALFIPHIEKCPSHFWTWDLLVVFRSMEFFMMKLFLLLKNLLVRMMKINLTFSKFLFFALSRLTRGDPHSVSFET